MSRCFVLDLFILELSNLKGLLVLIAQAPKAVKTSSRVGEEKPFLNTKALRPSAV
jgi:hypothetical protein